MLWQECRADPMLWIGAREQLLSWFLNPFWVVGSLAFLLIWLRRRTWARLIPLAFILGYLSIRTPAGTRFLTPVIPPEPEQKVQAIVLLGRGDDISQASAFNAVYYLKQNLAPLVYISGSNRYPARVLLGQGIASDRIEGDSCARTTWENATYTHARLSPRGISRILLITDPWQLPRATAAFRQVGFSVIPVAARAYFTPEAENRLAIREAAATLLYKLLGRNLIF